MLFKIKLGKIRHNYIIGLLISPKLLDNRESKWITNKSRNAIVLKYFFLNY